jgi:hypothetical protein
MRRKTESRYPKRTPDRLFKESDIQPGFPQAYRELGAAINVIIPARIASNYKRIRTVGIAPGQNQTSRTLAPFDSAPSISTIFDYFHLI